MNSWLFIILGLVFYIQQSYQVCTQSDEQCFNNGKYSQIQYEHFNLSRYNTNVMQCYGYRYICFSVTEIPMYTDYQHRDASRLTVIDSNITTIEMNSFTSMPNLQKINVTGCEVKEVKPGAFFGISKLEYLILSNNSITAIYKYAFNNLSNLKVIDLSMNKINLIENGSFLGVSLKELYVDRNNIQYVGPLIENCEEIVILDISNNKISSLDSIEHCRKLLVLNAANNQLKQLSWNQFGRIPLEILDLSSNAIDNMDIDTFNELNYLHILNLSSNYLTNLSAYQFAENPLEILDLSSNILEEIDMDSFDGLNRLHVLDLSGNKIKNPPIGIFQHLPDLRVLNLSSNFIINLQLGLFSRLTNLTVLNISNNELTSLPEEMFHDLENLEKLYVNNNLLTSFVFHLPRSLWKINIDGNPWSCQVLINILRDNKNKFIPGRSHNTSSISGISCNNSNQIVNPIKYKLNKTNKFDASALGDVLYDIKRNVSDGMQKFFDIVVKNQKELLGEFKNNNKQNQDILLATQQNSNSVLKEILAQNNNYMIKLLSTFNNMHPERNYTPTQEIMKSEKLSQIVIPHDNSNIFVGVLIVLIIFLIAFCLTVFYFIRSIKIHNKIRQIEEVQL